MGGGDEDGADAAELEAAAAAAAAAAVAAAAAAAGGFDTGLHGGLETEVGVSAAEVAPLVLPGVMVWSCSVGKRCSEWRRWKRRTKSWSWWVCVVVCREVLAGCENDGVFLVMKHCLCGTRSFPGCFAASLSVPPSSVALHPQLSRRHGPCLGCEFAEL